MTIKELNQIQKLNGLIVNLERQIKEAEAKAKSITSVLTDMPHAVGASDKVGDNAAAIADIRQSLKRIKRTRSRELKRLLAYIESVEDSQVQQIMLYHFVHGKSWTKTAIKMGGGNTGDGVRMIVYRYLKKSEKTRDPRA